MMRSLLAIALSLALASAACAQSKPGDPIRLTVSPARPPQRPLQYRFAFDEVAKRSGNAATDYLEARRIYRELRGSEGPAIDSQLDSWMEGDLKDFPQKEAEEFFQKYKNVYALLEKAARCDHCDWGHREPLRKQGFNLAIPEIAEMRSFIRMVAAHCRMNLAKGKIDEALHDARLGLVLARHTAESPLLICALVGYATTSMMMNRVDEIIQQPGAPSLYWALTDLPNPYISLRQSLDGERISVYGSFPGMADCVEDLNAGPLTEKQVQDGFQVLAQLLDGFKFPGAQNLLALNIAGRHEAAKRALIAAGRPREKVEAMPHYQVAMLHAFLQFDRGMDEMELNQALPPWEAYRKTEKPRRPIPASVLFGDPDGPALPLLRYFAPAAQRILRAQIRTDRRIAALRCVEAIRLYAETHDGKLPPNLSAIKGMSLPVDPLTGTPFDYSVTDKTAVLKGNVTPEEKDQPTQWLAYEITIRQ